MTPRQQLEALIDLFEPRIRAAFLASISDIVDNAILVDVIRAIESGDIDGAFRALGYSDAAMRPLTAAIEQSFEQGGVMTGATFPKYLTTSSGRAVFRFDVRNSRAEAWLRDKSSTLVEGITDDIRVNIRNTMTAGMEAGRNPRSVALDIVGRVDLAGKRRVGGVIGLNRQQEAWARSVWRRLSSDDPAELRKYLAMGLRDKRFDSIVERAIASGERLKPDVVEKLLTRYKDKALQYRGETIARTEAIRSLNASEYEAIRQAVEIGAAQESAVVRVWDDTGDGRTRPTHRELNGQRVGLNAPFVSPSGARMMFPGDTSLGAPGEETIDCRCRARTEIDWLAGIE